MTPAERQAFLAEQRVLTCATIGRDGWPHLMPLWYVLREGEPWAWTYAASQKAKNLERDPRATLQVEAGDTYDQLRGVMLKTRVELERDVERIAALGIEIMRRYAPGGDLPPEAEAAFRAQATKRVGLHFVPVEEPATWDHRKLGGTY